MTFVSSKSPQARLSKNILPVHNDLDTDFDERREIGALKSREVVGGHLADSVAAEECFCGVKGMKGPKVMRVLWLKKSVVSVVVGESRYRVSRADVAPLLVSSVCANVAAVPWD